MTSVVIEGLVMCVIGCILGVLLSFAAAFLLPRIPAIRSLISFEPGVDLIATVLMAALVLSIVGALMPAWRAVRMIPADALRRT